jgi:hypothetical protein
MRASLMRSEKCARMRMRSTRVRKARSVSRCVAGSKLSAMKFYLLEVSDKDFINLFLIKIQSIFVKFFKIKMIRKFRI